MWVNDTLVLFIEVMTGLANDRHDSGGFARYLVDPALFRAQADAVGSTGYYELTRNWVIGNRTADKLGRDFALINLGPPALSSSAQSFAALLATTPHRVFGHVSWAALLDAVGTLPAWLETYVEERGLRTPRPAPAPSFGCLSDPAS